jgi:transposase
MAQKISIVGIDIAKLVFHVVGMDDAGHVVLRKRITRSELRHFIATLPPALIGMEACGSAHYWARCFRAHGHEVRLIAPQFVRGCLERHIMGVESLRCMLYRAMRRRNVHVRPATGLRD